MQHTSPLFRPDIEGLRAVAVLLVVCAHYAIPGFSGGFIGVDIFFVISGYLITGILVREHEISGRIALLHFYANRLRRLFPALATMLIFSGIAIYYLLPQPQHLVQSQAAAMAALWVSNIYFSLTDVDYFSAETTGNAFLHTWSLGVEEQFYLLWPLCILAALRLLKSQSSIKRLASVFITIAALSLLICLVLVQHKPMLAFFMMPARAWQFAAGAGVWLLTRHHICTTVQAKISSGLGILALAAGLLLIGSNNTYPSALALLPTLGTVALLWAGAGTYKPCVVIYLGSTPMQTLGGLSYAWYLWHWPVLIIGQHLLPIQDHVGNTVLAIVMSLLAAIATRYGIENPIRYGRPAKLHPAWQIGLALCAMVLLNSQILRWHTETRDHLARSTESLYARAAADLPMIYQHGCDDWYQSDQLKPCTYGRDEAPYTAVLLGDSIGAQWFTTLTEMLDPQDWKIIVLTKSSCPMVDEPFFYQRIHREYTECTIWRERAIAWLQQQQVQRLFIGGTASSDYTPQQWTNGTLRILNKLAPHADAIYVIEANPTLPFNGPDCLRLHNPQHCQSSSANAKYQQVAANLPEAVAQQPKAHWLETASFVCPQSQCQALRMDAGEVVVFRDSQHLTATFAASAAKHFLQQMGPLTNKSADTP